MENKVNDFVIKVGGSAALSEPLEMGKDYKVTLEGAVVSTTDIDLENGSVQRLFRFKTALVASLESKTRNIQVRDKSSQSKQFKSNHYFYERDNPGTKYTYDTVMNILNSRHEDLMEWIISLENQE